MLSTVKYSRCLVTQWLENSLAHTQPHTPLFFFLSFFFSPFIIFKTNANEGAETLFSPFQGDWKTQGQASQEQLFKSHCHVWWETGAAAPLHSSAAAWWTAPVALKIHPWAAAEVSSPAVILLNLQWLPPPFHMTRVFVPFFLLKVSLFTPFRPFIRKCFRSSSRRRGSSDPTVVLKPLTVPVPSADGCQVTKSSTPAADSGVEHGSYLTACTVTYTSV